MMAGQYATTTSVSVERTEAEIKNTLRRYGATSIASMEEPGASTIAFIMRGRRVRFTLPLPDPTDQEFTHRVDGRTGRLKARTPEQAHNAWEQACRSSWRSLLLVVKATLEAVEAGIIDFDTAFLPHLMLDHGRTVAEVIVPQLELGSPSPTLALGPGATS